MDASSATRREGGRLYRKKIKAYLYNKSRQGDDWEEVYYRVNWLWNCAFWDRFWELPIVQIRKLLKFGERFKKEDLHHQEIPISTLTAVTRNKGIAKGTASKPKDFFYYEPKTDGLDIDPDVATIVFSQTRKAKKNRKEFPAWAMTNLPLHDLAKFDGRKSKGIYDIDFFHNDNIMLVACNIEEDWLYCKYAQINEFSGFIELEKGLNIYIPISDPKEAYMVHYRFKRMRG